MADKPKRGMAALLAEQRAQIETEPARPAVPARPASASRAASAPPQVPAQANGAGREPASPARTARASRPAGPGSTARLRSWYMTRETAETLAKAVDDLHFTTRAPKYEVLAAIVRAAVRDLAAVEAELRASQNSLGS